MRSRVCEHTAYGKFAAPVSSVSATVCSWPNSHTHAHGTCTNNICRILCCHRRASFAHTHSHASVIACVRNGGCGGFQVCAFRPKPAALITTDGRVQFSECIHRPACLCAATVCVCVCVRCPRADTAAQVRRSTQRVCAIAGPMAGPCVRVFVCECLCNVRSIEYHAGARARPFHGQVSGGCAGRRTPGSVSPNISRRVVGPLVLVLVAGPPKLVGH